LFLGALVLLLARGQLVPGILQSFLIELYIHKKRRNVQDEIILRLFQVELRGLQCAIILLDRILNAHAIEQHPGCLRPRTYEVDFLRGELVGNRVY